MSARKFALATALGLLAVPTLAQAPDSAGEKVTITAETFTVDQKNDLATFSGNVVVKSASVDVWAPKVVVHYVNGNTSDISSLEAVDGVRLKTEDQEATGERAVYDTHSRVLKLTGNVVVTNSSGRMQGAELVVDLKTNVSTFTAARGGRVTGVFRAQ